MSGKTVGRAWSGGLVVGLLGIFAVSISTGGNNIMDIINMEKVERMLAERRGNATAGDDADRRFLMQNSIDGDESFLHAGEDDDEETTGEEDLLHRNRHRYPSHARYPPRSHRPHRHNLTGVPDFASVLADLTGVVKPDKVLKTAADALPPALITKKEYLRRDWCKTEPMVQKVRDDGCLTRTILNRFCYGQCNSFYVPRNPPRRRRGRKRPGPGSGEEEVDSEALSFRSCGFCRPKKATWIVVTLRCPGSQQQFKKKRVQRIKQCKCIAENVGP